MKSCKRCEEELPLSSFYRHKGMSDGLLSFCKPCTTTRVSKHRDANLDSIRKYDRDRGNRQTGEYVKSYRASNPEKYKAHTKVNNAVRDDRLIKPNTCEGCGGEGSLHGHHEDYSKPLEVDWLCPACHKSRH
jgi:hypothetical protein